MTCTYSPEAYVFGSEENHALLEAETNELLHFGHNFPAPQGGSYWLDDTGNPDLTQNIHTWITCRMAHVYSLGFLHGEPAPQNWLTRPSPACAVRYMTMKTADGIRPFPQTAPPMKQARSATPTLS